MARRYLDGIGAHTLRHEALQVRIDGPILRGDGVEAGLGAPRGVGCFTREQFLPEGLLHRKQLPGARFGNILRKIVEERLLGEPASSPSKTIPELAGGAG